MIAILDTDYAGDQGHCACVIAANWTFPTPDHVFSRVRERVAPYLPGAFYERELPCLLHVLEKLPCAVDTVVIDGFVWLGENRPGLGWHLYEALQRRIQVVGVAKTAFHGADAVATQVTRGSSSRPLWVTAIGMETSQASSAVASMAGEHRLPSLVKLADTTARTWPPGFGAGGLAPS